MYNNFKKYSNKSIKNDNQKINICIFYKDRVPFDLRLVSVFNVIAKNPKYNFFMICPEDYGEFKKDILNNRIFFDYIILQRDYFDFDIIDVLVDKSKTFDFKIIYEIDDDLVHIDESNPGYGYYKSIKNKLEYIISHADLVTVTTENLKNQLLYLNDNIQVIPNRLIDSWLNHDIEFKHEKSIKIGYMGSIYHSWDLMLIEESIKNVKEYFSKKDIKIYFELIGGTDNQLDFANQIDIPSDCQPYFKFVEWFKNTVDWDIAIAPLEDSNLNICKSELKYLEYAVLGIPGVYSNIGPYSNCIVHENNGLVAFNNSPEEWEQLIIRLIEDTDLQKNIVMNAYEDVKNNYLIEKSVNKWYDIFESHLINPIKKCILSYYSLDDNQERILLVGHNGDNGGAEILLKNMIHEFQNQNVDVVVFVKKQGAIVNEYKKIAPTFVVDDDEKMEFYIDELSKLGFENAILNTVITGNFIPKLQKYNFYIISLVHELPGVIRGLHAENLSKTIADFANLVIFPSEFVYKHFAAMFNIKNRYLIQPQGFYNAYDDFDREKSRIYLEKKHNIPKNNQIILNVGRGEQRKGFDLFVEVSKKLKNKNFTFIWVGLVNDDMEQKYLNEIKENENFILTGFISDKDELMSYYDACDIFLLTSREDPFPSVVLEAFNAKKPVIAFENAGGFQDIILNDVSGYLVEYESTDEMIKKIELISDDNQLKDELGNNAKEICEKYNFKNYIHLLITYSVNGRLLKRDKEIEFLNAEIVSLKRQNSQLIKEKNEILSSSSWKITKPFRKFKRVCKKMFK